MERGGSQAVGAMPYRGLFRTWLEDQREPATELGVWASDFAEYQLDFVLSVSTLNLELSDNWRHTKAVWSVLRLKRVSLLRSHLSVRGLGQWKKALCTVTSRPETWRSTSPRRCIALSSWGLRREKAHGDSIETPISQASVRMIINI